MSTFAVLYEYTDDTESRDRHRPEHREFLRGLLEAGTVTASGPFTDADAGALILVRADDAEAVALAFDADPFAREGIVARRSIRPWNVVIGAV